MSPQSPVVQQHPKEFTAWFEKAKPALEEKAAAEKPVLDQLRKDSDEAAAKFPSVKGGRKRPARARAFEPEAIRDEPARQSGLRSG